MAAITSRCFISGNKITKRAVISIPSRRCRQLDTKDTMGRAYINIKAYIVINHNLQNLCLLS